MKASNTEHLDQQVAIMAQERGDSAWTESWGGSDSSAQY